MDEDHKAYDEMFVESIIEEINEMMIEKYKDDETVPILGLIPKEALPGSRAIGVHIFKTSDVKKKMGIE